MSWQERALCRDEPTEMFFPRQNQERPAIAICLRCPVRTECLIHALTRPEDHGVWGASTRCQRRNIRRAMRKAKAGAA